MWELTQKKREVRVKGMRSTQFTPANFSPWRTQWRRLFVQSTQNVVVATTQPYPSETYSTKSHFFKSHLTAAPFALKI